MVKNLFDPAVAAWFEREFESPTTCQIRAWEALAGGQDTLVAAPTGSGKTLAAFLTAINELTVQLRRGELAQETAVLYVSPLKALSNDVQINLEAPLGGIHEELTATVDGEIGRIHSAVRTGDTPASARALMRKRPPHILVTTPESLYILLGSASGRAMLATVKSVIIDEIHALIENKRGAHLALSLARLERLCSSRPTRIALSATQRPIERVADFLTGCPQKCAIVDEGHVRDRDLAIEMPRSPLEAVMSAELGDEIRSRMVELIESHRTTLVFVNTRRMAERLARALAELIGEDIVCAHHGSMSKERRLDAERRLKQGALKVLVATASLELGIDIGDVDLVCQLGSPRSLSMLLQRVGRSGHAVGGLAKGRFFPQTRDELIEFIALLDMVRRDELDTVAVPTGALDVLAQQLVAETAASGGEDCDSLFELFRGAMPYRDLTREAFDAVVRMLAEGYSFARGRNQAYVHFDAVNQKLSPRRQARLVAVTCGGAIPDNADYDVVAEPHGELVGSVNEDFAIESLPGNIFQLGNTSWRVLRVESSALRVEDAAGEPPNMPFWLGEAPARSDEFSMAVSRLRAAAAAFCASHSAPLPEISRYLIEIPGVGVVGAAQAAEYIYMGYVALGAMPTQETLVLERFFDESGGMQLVLHAPFGSRINRAWGLALRKRFCRTFNFELQAAAIEDAIVISLGEIHSFPLEDVWRFLNSSSVRDVLIQALLDAPMFAVRWRWVAACALALQRFKNGKKNPPRLMRMQAEDLVASVFPDQLACAENLSGRREVPDHPLVNQTIQDCLNEAMDINGLEDLIKQIEAGRKTLLVRDLTEPSPFALQVLNANPYAFLDDAPLEERRTQAVKSRRWLDSETAKDLGRLDQAAIDRVRDEIRPQPRDHEECHEALEALGFMLEKEQEKYSKNNPINRFIDLLYKEGRVVRFDAPQRGWCVTERAHELGALWPGAGFAATAAARAYDAGPVAAFELCLQSLVRARMEVSGPVRATELAEVFAVTPEAVSLALAALENQGIVFRGEYEPGCGEQWCDRRLLARIHRYTINRLRREIEPVPGAVFMRFLFDWQHLTVTTRLQSSDGLMALLEQMSGFEAPVAAWEKHILGPRMRVYQGSMLDELVRSGRATWLRLRPKQSSVARMSGTMRTTPISLMPRVDRMMWLSSLKNPDSEGHNLSAAAAAVRHSMTQLGPAFFDDIASYSKLLPAQCEQGLDELAALGALSCDSFAGLRALIRPNGKSAVRGRARTASLVDAGRWELVRRPLEPARPEFDESEVEAVARVLLRRYGVVFRAVLANEPALPPWRHLLWAYRRLEASGEVRGGRFVAGHSGEQFALSEAVSALREVRKRDDQKQVVAVNASDPLNLVGVVVPGVRIPAKSTNQLVFLDGEYVANRNGNAFNFAKTLDTATATRVRTALIEPKAGGRRRGSRPQWR